MANGEHWRSVLRYDGDAVVRLSHGGLATTKELLVAVELAPYSAQQGAAAAGSSDLEDMTLQWVMRVADNVAAAGRCALRGVHAWLEVEGEGEGPLLQLLLHAAPLNRADRPCEPCDRPQLDVDTLLADAAWQPTTGLPRFAVSWLLPPSTPACEHPTCVQPPGPMRLAEGLWEARGDAGVRLARIGVTGLEAAAAANWWWWLCDEGRGLGGDTEMHCTHTKRLVEAPVRPDGGSGSDASVPLTCWRYDPLPEASTSFGWPPVGTWPPRG